MRLLKIKKSLAIFLVLLFCINSFNLAENVFAKEKDEIDSPCWDGETKEVVYSNENYIVKMTLRDAWNDGYNIDMTIDNISDEDIDSWALEMKFNGTISNIWGASIKNRDESRYLIKHLEWNQDIKSGKDVTLGFTGSGNFDGFPSSIQLVGKTFPANNDDYSVMYRLESEWDDGFTSSIVIYNNSNSTIEDWLLEFDYDRTITEIWNGEIISHNDGHYIIKNAGYNSNINKDDNIIIGFNGNGGKATNIPSNYSLTCYDEDFDNEINENPDTDSEKEHNSTEVNSETDENEVSDSTNTDADENNIINEEDITISVNTESLFYNNVADYYVIDTMKEKLTGELTGNNHVSALSYCIKDSYGNLVKNGTIDINKKWEIKDFGLVFGLNELTITAISLSEKSITEKVSFFNTCFDMEKNTDIDLSDNDNDGLNNYSENLYETNPNEKDTDKDGLSDYEECILIGTDPLIVDTDNNGTSDADEDYDLDGLNNKLEMIYGTYPYIDDSDKDGEIDGKEVNKYSTNPMVFDTDEDGLSDYEDIILGFDPLKKDTDNNGIFDSDEKVRQKFEKQIENVDKKGLTKVEIEAETNGYIDSNVVIISAYNLDLLASNTLGLIGIPVDITLESEFETAKITLYYDESELGDTSEDDLAIAWHDKFNDSLVLLDDSVVDKENNMVSYITNHFSTYMLVDKRRFGDPRKANSSTNGDNNNGNNLNIIFRAPTSDKFIDSTKISITESFLDTLITGIDDEDKMEMKAYNGAGGIISNDKDYLTTLAHKIFRGKEDTSNNIEAISNFVYASMEFDNPIYESDNAKIFILMCDEKDFNYNSFYDYYINEVKNQGILTYLINYGSKDSDDMRLVARKAGGVYKKVNSQFEAISVAKEVLNAKDGYSIGENETNGYKELPDGYIYVDGTPNKDGSIISSKMFYIPYSDYFIDLKYYSPNSAHYFDKDRNYNGAAGIHGLFSDCLDKVMFNLFNAEVSKGIIKCTSDLSAYNVFLAYATGTGGKEKAAVPQYSRISINAKKYITLNKTKFNSANKLYKENINKIRLVVESVMDNDNKEIYISLSPANRWIGSDYVHYSDIHFPEIKENAKNAVTVATNMAAFGTFNSSDAGITVHCVYNASQKSYQMDCKYYLMDYYDYDNIPTLEKQDALGLAKSFEIIGYYNHTLVWNKGDVNMYPTLTYKGE